MRNKGRTVLAFLAAGLGGSLPPVAAAETRVSEGTNIGVDMSPAGECLAIDLLGSIWVVPAGGGDAERVSDVLAPAERPRWSPDGSEILFQTRDADGVALWRLDVAARRATRLLPGRRGAQQADWHPAGRRIVFTQARADSGLDLHELDLPTGLSWRISAHRGDETGPVWSADGRHLAYVLRDDDGYRLMLKRFAQPAEAILSSAHPLHAPSFRPDNTLVTYLAETADGRLELRMAILSEPPLERSIATGRDFFITPVSWAGRNRLYYAADGTIRTRGFEDRDSTVVPFSAPVELPGRRRQSPRASRDLPPEEAPERSFVLRARRLYDGVEPRYRRQVDLLIAGGLIEAVEPRRRRQDAIVIDVGDVTVMPGLIDAYGRLPSRRDGAAGPLVLAFGVTTLVTPDAAGRDDAADWSGATMPGPRLLRAVTAADEPADPVAPAVRLLVAAVDGDIRRQRIRAWQERGVPVLAANWRLGLGLGADLLLGATTLPASPLGRRYRDLDLATAQGALALLSGLADAGTPGLDELFALPQAAPLAATRGAAAPRQHAAPPEIGNGDKAFALASRPSGLPAGIGTQAELRALEAAGMSAAALLHTATAGSARLLGLPETVGRVAPGAHADLILIAGDPLADPAALSDVVAVVRNGRFYSLSGLLERVPAPAVTELSSGNLTGSAF